MIGMIVTGHGHFGTGLFSSVKLIAGEQKHLEAVDFDGNNVDLLRSDLEKAYEKLSDCEGVIVFSDLTGGSPFKTAVELFLPKGNVRIVAGTNLGMLCEIALARTMMDDLDVLTDMAVTTGKTQVLKFEFAKVEEEEDFEDGI